MTSSIQLINDQAMVVLPPEALDQLKAEVGATVAVVTSPNGIEIVADLEKAKQLELARDVMAEDRQALNELAK